MCDIPTSTAVTQPVRKSATPRVTTRTAVALRNFFNGSLYIMNRSRPLEIDISTANRSNIAPLMMKTRDLKSLVS